MPIERSEFYEPEALVQDVRSRLTQAKAASEQVDFLTFVPDGEPTLDLNLGKEIQLLRPLSVPVGAITNSSLLWREDVRQELSKADWVSLKIDSVTEDVWRQLNRPHKNLHLTDILNGIRVFVKDFKGRLVTETMLVKGLNERPESVRLVADFIAALQPDKAYLSVPIRPPPLKWVSIPDEESINRAYQIMAEAVNRVECLIGYEGDAFALTGNLEKDLLSITAVHPMRSEAVAALLARDGASWEVVTDLIAQGQLVQTTYNGKTFYLRALVSTRQA